jgi:hypothetical protein
MPASSNLVLDYGTEVNSSVSIPEYHFQIFGNRRSAVTSATSIGIVFFELSSPTKQFITKLESFKSLEPNWDSYGAQPPSSKIVETAITFVKKADKNELPLYFVAPGPNGELVIEFRKGNKEASAYINPDGSTELILNEGNNYVLEGTLEANYKDLLTFING